MDKRLVAGCMTGTSIDGIDAALVEIEGKGLGMEVTFVRHLGMPLGDDLAAGLRRLAAQKTMSARRIAALAVELGELHRDAVRELAGGDRLDLVAVHGQTVLHQPPLSWQLINPHPIAHGLGVPVIYDLRSADLSCGGQGAPLTPLADYLMFRSPDETRAVANLGGFCNLTLLPPSVRVDLVTGADLCACNQLLDWLAGELIGAPFDSGGQTAGRGIVKARPYLALAEMLEAQAALGRSLGTGDAPVTAWREQILGGLEPEDALRTACAAIARVIGDHTRGVDRLLLAGGGARNQTMVEEIRGRSTPVVDLVDDHGIPSAAREAVAMAILGALSQDRESISLTQVTGVREAAPIAGCWVLP